MRFQSEPCCDGHVKADCHRSFLGGGQRGFLPRQLTKCSRRSSTAHSPMHQVRIAKNMDNDLSFPCNGKVPPAIPNGDQYELVFLQADQTRQWGRPKVFLWFQMLTSGEWHGQAFYMACNVAEKGKWTASCKFWQAWVLAAGRRPTRADRMSTAIFKNKVFRARMRKVLKTAKQTDRTPAQQYSVVDELLEVLTGR